MDAVEGSVASSAREVQASLGLGLLFALVLGAVNMRVEKVGVYPLIAKFALHLWNSSLLHRAEEFLLVLAPNSFESFGVSVVDWEDLRCFGSSGAAVLEPSMC